MEFFPNNGNSNKGLGWRAKTAGKSMQLFAADVVGNIAELAFLRYEKIFNQTVPWLRSGFKSVMHQPVAMVQKPLEKMLEHAGNFEDKDLHDERVKQTEEKRLEGLLDAAYDYSLALTVGGIALVTTERVLSKVMKTDHLPWWPWMVDAAVHTGIVLYMGSSRMKPTTEKIKGTIESAMRTAGWSAEDAKKDATFATVYIVPNYLNWASNTAVVGGMYYGEQKNMWKPTEGFIKNICELGKKFGILGGAKQIAAV